MLTTHNYSRRCRPSGGSTIGIASSPRALLVRPKLPLRSFSKPRSTFNFNHIERAPFSRPKRFKTRRMSSCQKIDVIKKKIPDYTETAYREAVSRLKYLLAESYSPRTPGKLLREKSIYRRSNAILHGSAEDTDDRSVLSDCSKGLLGNISSRTNMAPEKNRYAVASELNADDCQLTPKELSAFIMRQEEYIEQLEQDSKYCKDELKNLIRKIREVVTENDALHDKTKTHLLQAFLKEYDDCDMNQITQKSYIPEIEVPSNSGKKIKLHQTMEGPMIMYESRISELEAQLTQAKIELKKAQEENQFQFKRLSENPGGSSSSETITQLDQVLKEKREVNLKLEDALRNLQTARERETEATQKVKRAMDSAQQAESEKSQAESEIRRLKDELERQREKIREATQDTCRRLTEERHLVERRYSQQVEQLSADVVTHWDAASKSHLEIEKQRREITDLKRELSQKQALIDDLKKELNTKITTFQSDLNQVTAEKDAIELEVATAKLAAERSDRQARQEQSRWQTEINSYKQRLERADADIVHCRRENLRLSEQIASLEKELTMNRMIHATDTKTSPTTPKPEKEKDLTTMIMDVETKHAATVGGLEDALSNQAKLVSRLTAECKSLTQRLEDNDLTHKKEMASLQSSIEYLSNKIQATFQNQKEQLPDIKAVPVHPEITPNPGDENYAHDFNQPTDPTLQPSEYENNENYQYPVDGNYPTGYTNEDYRQYEQYDPSMYQNEPNPEPSAQE